MTTTWQLSMGPNDLGFITMVLQSSELPMSFKYDKGFAKMVAEPNLHDRVIITCRAKQIAKGYIYRTFQPEFNPHKNKVDIYATIMIDEIVLEHTYMKGQRRNWTKIKE
jgi:hypothetical protein